MNTVLITGGTGLVGRALSKMLAENGYKVIVLTRKIPPSSTNPSISYARWDIKNAYIDPIAIQQADCIIHLAGAGVMDHAWTEAYKKEIVESRASSAKLLLTSLQQNSHKVKSIISASAIGWYGKSEHAHREEEEADNSFLGNTCKAWEESIQPAQSLGIRLVTLRIGIVLSKEGGALKEFLKPLQYRIAAILGNGRQIISWIHIEDLCRLFLFAIENEKLEGIYNAVAALPVSNKDLTITLAQKKGLSFYLPLHIPAFVLKLILGGRSIEVLKSATISNKKIEAAGFQFKFNTIEAALKNIVTN